ncbi:MAG: hypothetical protein U0P81_06860 [Holophagaceae bacterium]
MSAASLVEILDSAVKIGLGALISGVFTWKVTKSTLQAQDDRDRRAQRTADFEKVVAAVEAAQHATAAFVDALGDWTVNRDGEAARQVEGPLNQAKRALEGALVGLGSAHTRLILLGEPDAANTLSAYRDGVDAFYRDAWNRKDAITDPELGAAHEALLEPRAALLEILGEAYRAHVV